MDLIIIFPLCLIILFLLFNGIRFILLHHCHTCISRRARIGPKQEEDADDHYSEAGVEGADGARSLPPDNGAYLEPNQIVKRDTTYANINPHIESLQVEGILNRLINSVAAQTLYWSVPVQTEDHDCSQSPENLLKNWSQRILPCKSRK
ncbi:uncharacterized protein LOC122244809, partial [Penaeus japonicus]|uniref:uncharacterized protein LOC122244809 n=1 Tax=Penaeus japonicus TaxID=27405 RepID=UPI001C710E1B